MTLHNCDLCSNSTDFLPLPGDPSGKISICGQCGLVLVRERRNIEEIARAWDEIYASKGYDPNWPGVRARLFYVAEWIKDNIGLDGRDVLDIGAGNGLFLHYVRGHGGNYVGLDPSPANAATIRSRGLECYEGWAADSSPDIGKFDLVTLLWTLENTADCLEVLRYAKRQLKPGGHVVVATGSRINSGFRKPLHRYLPQDPNYPHDTHCFRWSDDTLEMAFLRVGLLPDNMNDWMERDEMISVAVHHPEEPRETMWSVDEPKEVEGHFRRWLEMYP